MKPGRKAPESGELKKLKSGDSGSILSSVFHSLRTRKKGGWRSRQGVKELDSGAVKIVTLRASVGKED